MESSVTRYESELTSLMLRFTGGEISFDELASWVEHNDLSWGSFELDSLAEKLALAVMHARWDSEHGDYPDAEIRKRIADDLAEIAGSRALP